MHQELIKKELSPIYLNNNQKANNMIIRVDIECETISDFYGHLSELRRQIKKETKRLKLNPLRDEFPKGVNLYDDNCYGSHEVQIKPENKAK
jgi:hypothetical protein